MDQIVEVLKENDRVAMLYEMTGSCILHMHIVVENLEEMERFMHESIYSLKKTVSC